MVGHLQDTLWCGFLIRVPNKLGLVVNVTIPWMGQGHHLAFIPSGGLFIPVCNDANFGNSHPLGGVLPHSPIPGLFPSLVLKFYSARLL